MILDLFCKKNSLITFGKKKGGGMIVEEKLCFNRKV